MKEDFFTKKARKEGLRSRAYFKLKEIDIQFNFFHFKKNLLVLDLGAVPGGWSKYLSEKNFLITAIDRFILEPIPRVTFHQQDIFSNQIEGIIHQSYDYIVSDLSENITGINEMDFLNSQKIFKRVFFLSEKYLKIGGNLVVKNFLDTSNKKFMTSLIMASKKFQKFSFYRSKISRKKSHEFYIIFLKKLKK